MCGHRGRTLGMVFQEPMSALNPVKTIGAQVAETVRVHRARRAGGGRRPGARRRSTASACRWRAFRSTRYPHELSGGQRQRVVIAMATVLKPKLLIADEPTTALDVTTQARILDLLRRLVAEDDVGLILISHDLAVVADMADRIAIMKDGEVVEEGETVGLFRGLRHPYSRMLLAASTYRSQRDPAAAGGRRARRADPRRRATSCTTIACRAPTLFGRAALFPRGGRCRPHHPARRESRPGRRIGQRQVDAGPRHPGAARSRAPARSPSTAAISWQAAGRRGATSAATCRRSSRTPMAASIRATAWRG